MRVEIVIMRSSFLFWAALGFVPASLAASLPTAVTEPTDTVTQTTATLRGSAAANGARTLLEFDLGSGPAFGALVAASPQRITGSGSASAVQGSATGLACGTAYYVRLRASNRVGASAGATQTFTTATCAAASLPPQVTTTAASAITLALPLASINVVLPATPDSLTALTDVCRSIDPLAEMPLFPPKSTTPAMFVAVKVDPAVTAPWNLN